MTTIIQAIGLIVIVDIRYQTSSFTNRRDKIALIQKASIYAYNITGIYAFLVLLTRN